MFISKMLSSFEKKNQLRKMKRIPSVENRRKNSLKECVFC